MSMLFLERFYEAAAKYPDKTALVHLSHSVTFSELEAWSGEIARFMRAQGTMRSQGARGGIVPILLERGISAIAAMLGVWKAGAVPCIIDTNYPPDRIRHISRECSARFILDEAWLKKNSLDHLDLNNAHAYADTSKEERHLHTRDPQAAGMVVFTSGSTGNPKGVVLPHRSISLAVVGNILSRTNSDVFLSMAPFSFIAVILDILTPLALGATIHIASAELSRDVRQLASYIRDNEITTAFMPPQAASLLLAYDDGCLRTLITGSEKVQGFYSQKTQIFNVYGASETCGPVTYFEIDRLYEAGAPIGRPYDGSGVYILDEEGNPVPDGEEGEICVFGQIAIGYLNQPEATAECFQIQELSKSGDNTKRLYRTGDMGRIRDDRHSGNRVLEYVQRKDLMVKVRGYRVEPGEIESAMMRLAPIDQALVKSYENASGETELFAVYTAKEYVEASHITEAIRGFLPEYMIPSFLEQRPYLPLNANGKFDRKNILPPDAVHFKVTWEPPKDDYERALCLAYESVLGVNGIGALDDFNMLGGNSILAIKLQSRLSALTSGIIPSAVDILTLRTPRALAAKAAQISQHESHPALKKATPRESWPLTFAERQMATEQGLNPTTRAYNVNLAFLLASLEDKFDERFEHRLEKAMEKLVERHPIMRSSYPMKNGEFIHVVEDKINVELARHACDYHEIRAKIDELNVPWDLSHAPLFKFNLFEIDENTRVLHIGIHHIITDGISVSLLMEELWKLYEQERSVESGEQVSEYVAPQFNYLDHAIWENENAKTGADEAKNFFLDMFKDGVPENEMPTRSMRPNKQPFADTDCVCELDVALIDAKARKLGVMTHTLLMAAAGLTVAKYCGSEDVVLGMALNGRSLPETTGMMGMFVNTLPVRIKLQDTLSPDDYIHQTAKLLDEIKARQTVPLESLVPILAPDRNASRAPIFDVIVNYQEEIPTPSSQMGFSVRRFHIKGQAMPIDLMLEIMRQTHQMHPKIRVTLSYSKELYQDEVANGILEQFKTIVNRLVAENCETLADLADLPEEHKQIIEDFYKDRPDYSSEDDGNIVALFRKQASFMPEKHAVACEGRTLTYRELDKITDKLACYLVEKGIGNGAVVGVLVKRSEMMPLCALGVLKAGAAYLPLDPSYPSDRLEFMLEDAEARIVIADEQLVQKLSEQTMKLPILLTRELETLSAEAHTQSLPKTFQPESLFVLLYTSGTTGIPNGVMLTHGNLASFCDWFRGFYDLTETDNVAAYASFSFDACLMDLYPALTTGGCVHVIPEDMRLDLPRLSKYFNTHGVTIAFMTTQLGRYFAENAGSMPNTSLRALSVGGEPLVPLDPPESYALYNCYGPTECTILSSICKVDRLYDRVPIGKPIGNTVAYVLDGRGRLAPIGVAGELCIAGPQVAAGYLHRPELTEEKFVSNPFSEIPNYARMYRTGDVVRLLPSGDIDFIGRRDFQVKIRGFRVELPEIESRIRAYPPIKDATVVAQNAPGGGKRAVAYIVADTTVDVGELNNFIEKTLPSYMVPAMTVQIDEIPLNPNGKVDQKKLPPIRITPEAEEIKAVAYDIVPEAEETEVVASDIMMEIGETEEPKTVAFDIVPEAEETEAVSSGIMMETEEPEAVALSIMPEAEETKAVASGIVQKAGEIEEPNTVIPSIMPGAEKNKAVASGFVLKAGEMETEEPNIVIPSMQETEKTKAVASGFVLKAGEMETEELNVAVLSTMQEAEKTKAVASGFVQKAGEMETEELQIVAPSMMLEIEESEVVASSMMLEAEELQAVVPSMMLEIEESEVVTSSMMLEAEQPQTVIPDTMLEAEESEVAAFRTETQELLCGIAAPILGLNREDFDITTDLLYAGLNSLAAIRMVAQISAQTGKFSLGATDIMRERTIEKIALMLANDEGSGQRIREEYEKRSAYPLTQNQLGLYFACAKAPDSVSYNIPFVLTLAGDIDVERLKNAIYSVIEAHPYLKTHLAMKDGEICQLRMDDRSLDNFVSPIKECSEADWPKTKHAFVRPFNFFEGPLFRVDLYRTPEHVRVLCDFHHIIFDGGSLNLFLRDLAHAWSGEELEVETLTSFELALAEKENEQSEVYAHAKAFFDAQFLNWEGASAIPVDFGREVDYKNSDVSDKPGEPQTVTVTVDKFETDQTNAPNFLPVRLQESGITPASLFLAATAFVVSRFASTQNVSMSTIISGREGLERLNSIGMLAKTLPILVYISPEETVERFLARVQNRMLETLKYRHYPYTRIVADYSFEPQIMYSFQGGIIEAHRIENQELRIETFSPGKAKFPINIAIEERKEAYDVVIEYDTSLFEGETMLTLAECIAYAACRFANPEYKYEMLHRFSIATPAQLDTIASYMGPQEPLRARALHALIEEHAAKSPWKPALAARDGDLSYEELNDRANRIAHALLEKKVELEDRIAFMLPRDSRRICAMLGIIKAGCAFVPVDSTYPMERIKHILSDSGAKYILTSGKDKENFTDGIDINSLLDESRRENSADSGNPNIDVSPENLCCVIYTSDSTGKPKGVMLTHENIVNCVSPTERNIQMTEIMARNVNFVSVSSIAFNIFIKDVFAMLANGQRMVFADEEQAMNPQKLAELFEWTGASAINTTPSIITQYMEFPRMREALARCVMIVLGAEKYPPTLFSRLRALAPNAIIFNSYGPSEAAVDSNAKILESDNITIGQPESGIVEHVMDMDGNPLPTGVVGELWIGGAGVARGYLNRPDLTAERFLQLNGIHYYKSGDLARWTNNGEIVILGRNDRQVNLRGLRIEPEEIESTINAFPGVTHSVVLVKKLRGQQYLAAYYTADREISVEELRKSLANTLCMYMLPSAYLQLAAMPLTPNGKVDTHALPDLSKTRLMAMKSYEEPRTDAERAYCEIFAKVLGLEYVGVLDNFFDLGGTSLLVTQLTVEAMNKNYTINYGDVFTAPTPRGLANLAGRDVKAPEIDIVNDVKNYDYSKIHALIAASADQRNLSLRPLGNICLTGATGFLGIHVLHEYLCGRENTGTAWCVLRGDKVSAEERLKNILSYYFDDDFETMFGSRIVIVDGDIQDPALFDRLDALPIDTLINCASDVRHFSAGTDIEDTNVTGVTNCIAFSRKKQCRFIQASTVSIAGAGIDGTPSENTLMDETMFWFGQNLPNKYVNSKFVAERFILEAAMEGLDVKVMRLGNLMARAADEGFQANFNTNSFLGQLRAYSLIGAIPYDALSAPVDFSPVDFAAKAVLKLSTTPTEHRVLHPYNNHVVFLGDVIHALRESGVAIRYCEVEDFNAAYSDALRDTRTAKHLSSLIAYAGVESGQRVSWLGTKNDYTTQTLLRLGFKWPVISDAYLARSIEAMKGLGFFNWI